MEQDRPLNELHYVSHKAGKVFSYSYQILYKSSNFC